MATHSIFCLENPLDRGAPAGYGPLRHKDSDTTEATEHTSCRERAGLLVWFLGNQQKTRLSCHAPTTQPLPVLGSALSFVWAGRTITLTWVNICLPTSFASQLPLSFLA